MYNVIAMKMKAPDGTIVEVDKIEITEADEQWSTFKLEDGTVIRVKIVPVGIFRAQGRYNEDGEPVYIVKSQNVISTDVPERLRKPL